VLRSEAERKDGKGGEENDGTRDIVASRLVVDVEMSKREIEAFVRMR